MEDRLQGFVFGDFNKMSRRHFVKKATIGTVGGCILALSGCSYEQRRGFEIRNVFRLKPSDLFTDVAFGIAGRMIDFMHAECSRCKTGFRLALEGLDLAVTVVMVYCPHCGAGARIAIGVSQYLFQKLISYGIRNGVAYLIPGSSYFVHMVAAASTSSGYLDVDRAYFTSGVSNRDPIDRLSHSFKNTPRKIYFFTEVKGASRNTVVYHRWIRNGQQTDRIRLNVGVSQRWRTWSMKQNLGPGAWIVTVETTSGAVLARNDFQIIGYGH